MILSKNNIAGIEAEGLLKPDGKIFALPEKVLQFGTGVLLRGLCDYFIDKANKEGLFNGRVVVVKSTGAGDALAFDKQDCLYTICVRGIEEGKKKEENIISAAISRVLSAKEQWKDVLQCAWNKELQIIISNTTEVGIQLVNEDIHQQPPLSFPGKLLAFLYERYKAFGGRAESGMVIIPTELITENGKKLKSIVTALARFNQLEEPFILWLEEHNSFCNSLVDRILPGKPDVATVKQLQRDMGYEDELIIMAEVYRLWAIEGDQRIQSILSFAAADKNVIIEPDIEQYKELKLRLLNGTHTLSCGLAFLAGFDTVKVAMSDANFSAFIAELMLKEIAPSIPYPLPDNAATNFGLQVLDRFRNPYLNHQWLSITLQYTSKMKMRAIPLLLQHYQLHNMPPQLFSLGFAAYLLFMRAEGADNKYYGRLNGVAYPVNDDKAAYYSELWQYNNAEEVVQRVLQNKDLWEADLSKLNGFAEAVTTQLQSLMEHGASIALTGITK